ncbi:MAG: 2-C-methyl-D-erythritol 2,4-cyclodiphosphate synthase [Chlamydiota bacterium]|nr:2-C-methyl-D-erythritol 2,4-cyclodiphosphate synthase [Chlamydiota bacterium]
MKYKVGIGQDSHRFQSTKTQKNCIIAGLSFDNVPGFDSNSDGDVVFHAITNAISSITGEIILGGIADKLCLEEGITDSEVYLKEALKTLKGQSITHIAITLEGKRPKFKERLLEMRANIARVIGIETSQVGITATTGEELTGFGKGEGVQCFVTITVCEM